MNAPERPMWWEGVSSQQPSKALAHSLAALVGARIEAVAPHGWGALSLEMDAAALAAGQVRVARFAGVLPEGTPLAFGEGDAEAPAARAAEGHFPPEARALELYLAVARERSPDAAEPSGETAPVGFARLDPVLLFGDEPRDGFEALKIAEVLRWPTGELAFSPSYVAPCLRVAASPFLAAGVRDVAARLAERQRELAAVRRSREGMPGDLGSDDVSLLLALLALNSGVPLAVHLAEAPGASPREAYLVLAQLTGQLSTFAAGADPAGLPGFAHGDLRSTFEPLFSRLLTLIDGLATAPCLSVPLEERPGGLHLARIEDERILEWRLFLAVRSDLPERQVAEMLPKLCKVAASGEILALMEAAAPGLELRVVQRPPPPLPFTPGTLHFSLGTGDDHWQGILASRNIAIYLPPPFDPVRTGLELLALGSRRG